MRAVWLLPPLLAAAVGGCGSPTEIVAAVKSDLPAARQAAIELAITRPDGTPLAPPTCTCTTDGNRGCVPPTQTLGIQPAAFSAQRFRVVARGWDTEGCSGAQPLVEQSATVRFQEGRRLLLELGLYDACVGVVCPLGQTCDPTQRACVDDTRDMLPGVDEQADLASPPPATPDLLPPPDLGPTGPILLLPRTATELYRNPVVATDGTQFLLGWEGATVGANAIVSYVATVSRAGLAPSPTPVSMTASSTAVEVAGSDGAPFAVAYQINGVNRVDFFTPGSGLTAGAAIASTPGPTLAYDGTTALMTAVSANGVVSIANVPRGGVMSSAMVLSGANIIPRVIGRGGQFDLVWDTGAGMVNAGPYSPTSVTLGTYPTNGGLVSPGQFGAAHGPASVGIMWYSDNLQWTFAPAAQPALAFNVTIDAPLADDPPWVATTPTGFLAVWTEGANAPHTLHTLALDPTFSMASTAPQLVDISPSANVLHARFAANATEGLLVWGDGLGNLWIEWR